MKTMAFLSEEVRLNQISLFQFLLNLNLILGTYYLLIIYLIIIEALLFNL